MGSHGWRAFGAFASLAHLKRLRRADGSLPLALSSLRSHPPENPKFPEFVENARKQFSTKSLESREFSAVDIW